MSVAADLDDEVVRIVLSHIVDDSLRHDALWDSAVLAIYVFPIAIAVELDFEAILEEHLLFVAVLLAAQHGAVREISIDELLGFLREL